MATFGTAHSLTLVLLNKDKHINNDTHLESLATKVTSVISLRREEITGTDLLTKKGTTTNTHLVIALNEHTSTYTAKTRVRVCGEEMGGGVAEEVTCVSSPIIDAYFTSSSGLNMHSRTHRNPRHGLISNGLCDAG